MKLRPVGIKAPPGAAELLAALGEGEGGFGGTPVGKDPGRLGEWLDYCVHLATAEPLSEDFPAQANYWIVDDAGRAVGLLRMHPRINAQLLERGGHLGYYIAPAHRRRGHARAALREALGILRRKRVGRALVTVDSDNPASQALVQSAGGVLEDERLDPATGRPYRRYWLATADGPTGAMG